MDKTVTERKKEFPLRVMPLLPLCSTSNTKLSSLMASIIFAEWFALSTARKGQEWSAIYKS